MTEVLIIEDDKTLVEGLKAAFSFHGLQMVHAQTGRQGLEILKTHRPDLVILDIMLPDIDGYDLCRRIRQGEADLPIIFLSAKSQESDKLLGFELGAFDYLTKPFSVKELLARVRVHLDRRLQGRVPSTAHGRETPISWGNCRIHLSRFELQHGDRIYKLTAMEQKLLALFLERPRQVLSRDLIIDAVWGDEYDPSPKALDNLIYRLRQKLEDDPQAPRCLVNVHGAGFTLQEPQDNSRG